MYRVSGPAQPELWPVQVGPKFYQAQNIIRPKILNPTQIHSYNCNSQSPAHTWPTRPNLFRPGPSFTPTGVKAFKGCRMCRAASARLGTARASYTGLAILMDWPMARHNTIRIVYGSFHFYGLARGTVRDDRASYIWACHSYGLVCGPTRLGLYGPCPLIFLQYHPLVHII